MLQSKTSDEEKSYGTHELAEAWNPRNIASHRQSVYSRTRYQHMQSHPEAQLSKVPRIKEVTGKVVIHVWNLTARTGCSRQVNRSVQGG